MTLLFFLCAMVSNGASEPQLICSHRSADLGTCEIARTVADPSHRTICLPESERRKEDTKDK